MGTGSARVGSGPEGPVQAQCQDGKQFLPHTSQPHENTLAKMSLCTDRQADRQADRQTDHRQRERERQASRRTNREQDRQPDRALQTNADTCTHMRKCMHRHTCTRTYACTHRHMHCMQVHVDMQCSGGSGVLVARLLNRLSPPLSKDLRLSAALRGFAAVRRAECECKRLSQRIYPHESNND